MIHDGSDIEQRLLPRPTVFTANLWYLLAAAGLPLLSLLMLLLSRLHLFQGSSAIFNALYEIGILALPVGVYLLRNRPAARALRIRRPDPVLLLLTVALAAVGVLMANALTAWWLLLIEAAGGTPQASGIAVPTNTQQLLQSILLIGLIPAVCEEMLFRGGLMSAWEPRGRKTALLLTSVLFALLHGTIAGLPNQLVMGLVLGYVLVISDSIYVSMTYHAVHNSMTLLLTFLAAQTTTDLSAAANGTANYAAMIFPTVTVTVLFILLLRTVIARAKRLGINTSICDALDIQPVGSALRLKDFVPLLLAFLPIAFNYAADFAATFGQ